jgi:hypothetical protein
MARLPAHCSHCGLIFITPFGGSNSRNMMYRDNAAQCPRCQHIASVVDGTFDFVGNTIRVISAPPRTIAILSVLQEALRAANAGKNQEEIVAGLKQHSPEFAKAAETAIKGGRITLAMLLLYLLASCSTNFQQTLDWNKLVDQVRVYMTGATPYPDLGKKETSPSSEQQSEPSRQQRRQRERQIKKQQKPPKPLSVPLPKPKSP